ncbi:MAG: glycosyltransferase family 2 protein [Candidatus Woesearchaeota archaeon]
MNDNLISVVIPAYNEEKYISRCLDSLIEQNHPSTEVIVVNNLSSDKTFEIA